MSAVGCRDDRLVNVTTTLETWPLTRPFIIARGSKTEARVIVVHASDGVVMGRGEAVPYARYGETCETALAALAALRPMTDRGDLPGRLPPGAARNALDCALWDYEAKRRRVSAAQLAGVADPRSVQTAYTLSLDTPAAMAYQARAQPRLTLLKLKLGGADDPERMQAVRQARPEARLLADANESWTVEMLEPFLAVARATRMELIEQPLPANADAALAALPHPVPVCADESAHTTRDLAGLRDRYDAVNVKLDKAGGLTEALAMVREASRLGFRIMVGSMVATSLAAAPALLLAGSADWVDLDGPLLLAKDREHGLVISEEGWINPPDSRLWG